MRQLPTKPDVMLYLDDHRGVYIPRDFALCTYRECMAYPTGVPRLNVDDDMAVLKEGPDHEAYWDTWSDVCDHLVVTSPEGVAYRLYQDGALWLVPDGMEMSDDGSWHWPTHLLRTRGGTACGTEGDCDADIERVTCEECRALHDEACVIGEVQL